VSNILLEKFNAIVVALSRTQTPELIALSCSALMVIECDVCDETALTNAVSLAATTYGHIDGLILNAGTLDPLGRIGNPDILLSSWKTHFDVNFFSLVTALKAALPALRKSKLGGRVVFVSSGAAVEGPTGWGPYSASKAAMNSLCRTLADEEPELVSVAVRPGKVDTNMQFELRDKGAAHMTEPGYAKFAQAYAEGTLLKPEDPGHVLAALSIQAPKSLSGQFVNWNSKECKEFMGRNGS
jgi:NAD(P)-dependent dehydrogenase (short-subunit alcohol dehydrogenase family)